MTCILCLHKGTLMPFHTSCRAFWTHHTATPVSFSTSSLPRRALHSSSSSQKSRPRPPFQVDRTGPVAIMSQTAHRSSSSSSSSSGGGNITGAAAAAAKRPPPPPNPPRPSASVILLSPTNEVLLLHRVQTSTSFPSAHVFPGGNLSPFHEPPLPPADTPEHHQDSLPYRLAAIRETFEEAGILLARPLSSSSSSSTSSSSSSSEPLLTVPDPDAARRAIHSDEVKFPAWLADTLRARPLTDELVPFTRWITPAWSKGAKRFTTQMYLFLMPLDTSSSSSPSPSFSTTATGEIVVPVPAAAASATTDGGIEHTAATFAPPREWLRRQEAGEIVLFPPQCFLLTMVARAFEAVAVAGSDHYEAQRRALLDFVTRVPPPPPPPPPGSNTKKKTHPTALIPWTDKTMSPEVLFVRRGDGRLVLGIDKPAAELRGTGRGGDFERVVLARFGKQGPTEVEVRNREDVLREEREAEAREQGDDGKKSKL